MGDPQFDVDLLAAAEQGVRRSVEEIEDARRRLAGQIEPLGTRWAAPEGERLRELWRDYVTSADEARLVLVQIGGLIDDARRQFTEIGPGVYSRHVRDLPWIGIGATGDPDLSERVEEILDEEWR